MLRSINEIVGYTITDKADEVVGRTQDFYFDDLTWSTRYVVVDSGVWLPGRKVLISVMVAGQPDWGGGVSLPINLTKEQIENAPHMDESMSISRQHEIALAEYYQWPQYWSGPAFLDPSTVGMHPQVHSKVMEQAAKEQQTQEAVLERTDTAQVEDTHLRSINEVTGYYIQATDGEIGHVEDFIVDTDSWIIRYMVIDTKNWLPGKKVLISPQWVDDIKWSLSKVYVDLRQEQIQNSPEYDPFAPVNRAYETRLYDFYGRPKYW